MTCHDIRFLITCNLSQGYQVFQFYANAEYCLRYRPTLSYISIISQKKQSLLCRLVSSFAYLVFWPVCCINMIQQDIVTFRRHFFLCLQKTLTNLFQFTLAVCSDYNEVVCYQTTIGSFITQKSCVSKKKLRTSRPSFSLIHCLCSGRVLLVIFFAALAAVMLPFVILAPLALDILL